MSKPNETITHNAAILMALKKGVKLTPLTILKRFGCLRASARIYDLRHQGNAIDMKLIRLANGKYVAEYSLGSGI
jgi:hypothetical protein